MRRMAGLLVVAALTAGCSGLSSGGGSASQDWCFYFEKAGGQMQNVANGANLSTATVADEAKYFGQMSGDLSTVAELSSGRVAVLAQSGSVAAAQARVRLLGGYGLGGPAHRVLHVMNVLRPKCS